MPPPQHPVWYQQGGQQGDVCGPEPEKIKKKDNYEENLTNDYNILNRIRVRVVQSNIVLTISLMHYLHEYDCDLEVLEYIMLFKKMRM